jgi:hypothetical protein
MIDHPAPKISEAEQQLFQRQQSEIYPGLAQDLISLTPEHWHSAVLELTATQGSVGHTIWSDEGHRDIVSPSMELFEHTRRLELLFAQYKCPWVSAKFRVWEQADGNWSFQVDYGYAA